MFRKPLFCIFMVVLLAAAGGGYYYYRQTTSTVQAASATPLQTTTVKRGNLVLSASGTGSIITVHEAQLGFETGGELAELNVAVGDEVKSGDVLAIAQPSDSAATIQSRHTSAPLSVLQAQQTLVNSPEYQQLKTAEANLNWCSSAYSQAELDSADAKITSTQASIQLMQSQITEYQAQIADLQDPSGADSLDLAIAQAKLENAMAQLEVVEQESISSTIVAPFDGTILSISAQVGDNVGTNPFILLANLSQPYLEVLVDETDLNNIGIGYEVQVTFDALPNQTFTGHVISISPSLVNVANG